MANSSYKVSRFRIAERRESLIYRRTDADRRNMETAYKEWLCRHHGWLTSTKTCHTCHGERTVLPNHDRLSYSRLRTWKRHRIAAGKPPYLTEDDRETCPTCDGDGTVTLSEPMLDIKRAEAHIADQRDFLEDRAKAAIEAVEQRLFAAGLRPYVTPAPATLAAYDEQAAEQARLKAALTAAREAADAAQDKMEADYQAMSDEEKVAFLNRSDRVLPYQTLRREAEEIRQQMAQITTHHGFWYRPGNGAILWAETRNPHRYWNSPTADARIVITPGRAPADPEIDAIVGDSLNELSPQLLAA